MILAGQKKQELLLYVVLWAILFMSPVIAMFFSGQEELGDSLAPIAVSSSVSIADYDWDSILHAWSRLSMFLLVFLLHNFLLAPILVYAKKKWRYAMFATVLFVAWCVYEITVFPHPRPELDIIGKDGQRMERKEPGPPRNPSDAPGRDIALGQSRPRETGRVQQDRPEKVRPDRQGEVRQDRPKGVIKHDRKPEPPTPFGGDKMAEIIIMAMFWGLNIGAKFYFKTSDDRKRMRELEHENLQQKMEALTYQLNPHFFMNTLNNIHALVSIDPERAETTIEVLSDLMRYVLYEGSKPLVPLAKDLDFLRSYVDIMRIRCTDAVRIDMTLPDTVPDMLLPPLLFATFVENAFKHGISYERPSFIEIGVHVIGDHAVFFCRNSRKPATEDTHGGVGLQNAKKRLGLILGSDYSLEITPSATDYKVQLRVPMQRPC